MVMFKSNKDNNDYFMIGAHVDLGILLVISADNKLPENVAYEVSDMFFKKYEFERTIGHFVTEIAFRKESILGQFLINHCDYKNIINEDSYIYLDSVRNALLIAIYTRDPIAKEIETLFINQDCGSKEELVKKYDANILDYILTNNNFEQFMKRCESDFIEIEKEYVVYEDGQFSKQVFSQKQKCKKKDSY